MVTNHAPYPAQARLLLVEDDASLSRTLAGLLREDGFVVQVCHRARATLDCLAKDAFEVLVLDLCLPDMEEQRFLRQACVYFEQTPTIINAGFHSLDTAQRALALGAVAYLETSDDAPALLRHVHRAVEMRLRRHVRVLERRVALESLVSGLSHDLCHAESHSRRGAEDTG